jgi:anti-sigma factor RsiW
MNCEAVRDLLSAYYDRELAPDVEVAVREHLQDCPECAEQLSQFAELSKLAADMRQPEVPAGMWSSIDASLHAPPERSGTKPAWRRLAPMATAAMLLVAASLALLAWWMRHPADEHHEMAETFGRYLDRFQQSPEKAEEVLLARYGGRLVDPQQAHAEAQFSPNAPAELPQGFSREAIYVLKMPCCTCTQTIYKDDRGHVLSLFEHTELQRSWFGDRPTITAQCHGKPTCLVQLQGQLAACWKSGPRHLTIVGAQDVEQVSELVAYLDAQQRSLQAAREPT